MHKLIINADDFGLSKDVNDAILEAHKFGTITSTSLMTNMGAFEHAINVYEKTLGIGVHLNLTWGNSLITNQPFNKYNKYKAILYLIKKDLVEKEFRKQIEKILEAGIRPDHLNTHHHIHAFRPIKETVIKLANEYHIYKIRWPKEKLNLNLKNLLINLNLSKCPIKTTDNFFGFNQPILNDSFLNFKGTAELCCHPSKSSNDTLNGKNIRTKEFEKLMSKEFLNNLKGIELISFKEL